MKKTILLALLMGAMTVGLWAEDYTSFVNPFIGTQTDETGALSGSTFPGATMPQGMVQHTSVVRDARTSSTSA